MLNFHKLQSQNPFVLGTMLNSLNQEIAFVEHPTLGDEYPVICVCEELELASASSFYELDDMTEDHGEYEPKFIDGKYYEGDFQND